MQAPMIPTPIISRVQPQRPSLAPPRTNYIPATMLPGFFINSESDILPNDIPTDGTISVFPYRDLSRIVLKQWSGSSNLETAVYILQQPQSNVQTALPPPPPPVQQDNSGGSSSGNVEINAVVEAVGKLSEGMTNAFSQLNMTLQSMQENMENLNSKFINDEGRG